MTSKQDESCERFFANRSENDTTPFCKSHFSLKPYIVVQLRGNGGCSSTPQTKKWCPVMIFTIYFTY